MQWSQQKQSVGIAYFVPVATRERPESEGGARENPSLSLQQCSIRTLPLGRQNPATAKPSASTHAHLPQHEQSRCTHEHSRGERNSLWLTYWEKEQQRAARRNQRTAEVASSEHGLLQKSSQQKQHWLRQTRPAPLLPLDQTRPKRPLKVHDRVKPGERHTADSDKSMSDSLSLQLPRATYITALETRSGSGSGLKHTPGNKTSAMKVDLFILTRAVLATVRVVTHLLV